MAEHSIATRVWRIAFPSLLLCIAAASGQEPGSIAAQRTTQHPLSSIGLAVGEHVPDFRAPDQDGVLRDFDSLRGPGGIVMYFYRSADWCIYCRSQLEETEASREDLVKKGFGVVGVSTDSPQILKKFADEKNIRFPLLSDPESKLIRKFQVFDDTVLPDTPGYGVPYHGSYIIDKNGVVTAKLFDTGAILSHSSGSVVSRLFGSPLNTHEKIVRHNNLTLTYYASTNAVSPGDEIELFLDVALNDDIHVYAPGGRYIPIDWQLTAREGVTAHAAVFPPAQALKLSGPEKETATGYSGHFQLSRRVTISPKGAAVDAQGNVAVQGTFAFQACDATTCFPLASIPLEWKLGQTRAAE